MNQVGFTFRLQQGNVFFQVLLVFERFYKDLGISSPDLEADYNPDLYAKKIMNQFVTKNNKLIYSDKTILSHK